MMDRKIAIRYFNAVVENLQQIILGLDTGVDDDVISAAEQAGEALTDVEGVDWPDLNEGE